MGKFNWEPGDLEISQCLYCLHWKEGVCPAFPKGVPEKILRNESMHGEHYPGQVGNTIFESDGLEV